MNERLKEQVLALLRQDEEIIEVVAERLERSVLFKELRELREEVNKRFEAMNERFEAMNKRFEAMREDFNALREDFKDTKDWVGVVAGGFQTRTGRKLEEAVAGTLRVALSMKDLDPETIQMRRKVADEDGLIGPRGRTYEYNIFVTNSRTCVFEVKSVPDEEDVDRFADKCDLVARALGLESVEKVIVTLAKTPSLARRCQERGVTLA